MTKMTLDKILQSQGFGTRRECRHLIQAGAVSIGGSTATDYDTPLDTADLVFTIDDEDWRYRKQVYIVLNKPGNYECSRKPSHHPTVLSLLPEAYRQRDVQPVGRLDHDTTGLLLLSDDGAFIHAQSSPKHGVAKTYLATTAEPVTDALLRKLREGVKLIDEPAPLAAVHVRQCASNQLEIVLAQGKYHQVKRMLAAAGNHCAALSRTAIGCLQLADLTLAEGEWCHLEPDQLALLNRNPDKASPVL